MITDAAREYMRHLSALGAAKGGRARAASLTPKQRSAAARRAAVARWQWYAVHQCGGDEPADTFFPWYVRSFADALTIVRDCQRARPGKRTLTIRRESTGTVLVRWDADGKIVRNRLRGAERDKLIQAAETP